MRFVRALQKQLIQKQNISLPKYFLPFNKMVRDQQYKYKKSPELP